MEKTTVAVRSRGMVAVESQTVSASDMKKADTAAGLRMGWPSLKVLEQRCLYYELDGQRMVTPLGLPGRQLEAVWEYRLEDEGLLLSELLESNNAGAKK